MAPRHVLITGATRGIGLALVRHCLDAGDLVMGCGRTGSSVEHERYTHHSMDVTSPEAVDELFDEVRNRFGTLDVLINNAGIASMNAVALTPFDTARRIVETNFLGPFELTRGAIRIMRGSPAPRIVNLTSVAVPLRIKGEAVYAASKSALETFTRIAAYELGSFGITCNAVGPSPIETGLVEGVPQEKMRALIKSQAIPRWAVPEDVVNVVEFFLRPESGMVTGQVIYLGGAG
jgi:3-oxoacyl-[acyl-carrier protein] reductase